MMEWRKKLAEKYGRRRTGLMFYLLIIGVVAFVIHMLVRGSLNDSSLYYIFVPYCIALAITWFRSYEKPKSMRGDFFRHIVVATSILFSTSILIGEGFICIIFFLPIYLLVVSVAYLIKAFVKDSSHYAMAIPALVLVISLEGTTEELSFPRDDFVEITRTTSLSVAEITDNIAKPFTLEKSRHWLISIFPMPYRIDAGSLNTGDVHTIYTRYHRWFIANTHEGEAELLIERVTENKVKTRVLSDTTYFSNYLQGTATEIDLTALDNGDTQITFRLYYQRKLDPAWYFQPLQKYGVSKMGELIIDQLMVRESG